MFSIARVTGTISLLMFLPILLAAQMLTVADIHVFGTQKTKSFMVTRVMNFEVGDKLDKASLKETIRVNHDNIYNLAIFNKVEIKDSINGDSIYFDVTVKERWYLFPISYVAFEERTFGEWWEDKDLDRMVYGLGAQWRNVTGRAEDFYFYGQLGYSRRFSIVYDRPFIIPKWKIDGGFSYRYVNRKEIGFGTEDGILQLARLTREQMQTSHSATASLKKRITPRKIFTLGFSYQWFRPHDSVAFYNDRYLTTTNSIERYPSIFLRYVDDQRDIQSFPLEGYKLQAGIRQSGFGFAGTARFMKGNFRYAQFIPLGQSGRFNFSWGIQEHFLFGNEVPFFDKNFLGFDNFVRGYEKYVIDGSFMHINKAEMKFAIIPRHIIHVKQIPFRRFQDFPIGLYLTLFADAGIVIDETFSNSDQFLKDRLLTGAGAGVNFITIYDLLLRLEYSFNHLGEGNFFLSTRIAIR